MIQPSKPAKNASFYLQFINSHQCARRWILRPTPCVDHLSRVCVLWCILCQCVCSPHYVHTYAGDTQHFQAPAPPEREGVNSRINKSIGTHHQPLSPKSRGISRHQQKIEKQHSRYPFGKGTLWLSVVVFISFVLACLYWITYIASTQP